MHQTRMSKYIAKNESIDEQCLVGFIYFKAAKEKTCFTTSLSRIIRVVNAARYLLPVDNCNISLVVSLIRQRTKR